MIFIVICNWSPGFRSRRLQAPGFQLLIGSHPLKLAVIGGCRELVNFPSLRLHPKYPWRNYWKGFQPVNVRENKRHCRRADKPPIREVCWSKPTEPSQNFNTASFFHVLPFSACSSLDLANFHPGQMDHLSFSLWFCLFLPSLEWLLRKGES